MAMDVEYEEYSTTSSSKHHGWKLEVSRRHRETSEMETLESRIAEEYAKIDQGLSVGDLTAPRAARLVAEMDRSARLIANRDNTNERVMYITYPDREGLCGALPSLALASSALAPNEREGEVKNASLKDTASALVETDPPDPPDRGVSVSSSLKSLASRLADAMPLVRVNTKTNITKTHVDKSPCVDDSSRGARDLCRVVSPTAPAPATKKSSPARRPDRLVEYDFSIGVDRARELTDAELHERAGAVNRYGEVAETAFRDLNQVD